MNKQPLNIMYKNLVYTHKIHEKEAYISKIIVTTVRFTSIVFLSLALLLQFYEVLMPTKDFTEATIILTVLSVFIQIFELSFSFENKHDAHRSTAKSAVSLKNKLRIFKGELDLHTTAERDALVDEVNGLYKTAPQTGKIAEWLVNRKI